MGLIPESKIAEIRDRTDIVAIIGEHVPLRRAGVNHLGLCPFHQEKSPSFNVSASKQFFYCFGCQKSGDVFRFLMELEGRTFVDVARDLARRAGVDIPEEAAEAATEEADHVFVNGASRMAASFDAVETVRSVLTILEQQLVVVSLLRDVVDRGLNVAIGSETGMQPLADCAVVVAPYTVDGEQVGTVGVLGPTRMNYPQALAAVAVVGQRLGNRLSEG